MQLKKDISISNLLFIGIGSIVGSGWLFASFYAAQIAGPAAIFSWILGGLCIAVIALVYAELTTMLPLSGGSIAFPLLGFGKMSSAVFGWVTWLGMVVIAPIEVQAVIQYASNYIPSIVQKVDSAEVLTEKGFFLAAVLMLILNIINMVGVKIMAETNKFIVIWKLIIPVAAALILLTFKTHPANLTAAEGFAPFGFNGVLTAIAVGGISFSYMGFQNVIFLAGETKNPQRAIPIALFGSIIICMILYLMLQIGFILSVNPSSLLNGGWSKISFAGDAGPFAGIFLTLGLVFMAKVLYFDAVLSPMGTGVSYVASSSRILYYLSLHKDVPKVLSQVNRFSVPWVAIIVNFIAGMCLFLPFSGWQSMVAFLVAAQVIALACGPVCLPLFRKRFADFRRPFLLPYSTLISFAAFYVCNLMLQWTGWSTIWKLEIAVGIGIALFIFSYLVNGKFKTEKIHFKSFIWLALYLSFSGIISYFGTFGGGTGLISMKMSFLVVAISSFIVFVIAQKSAIEPTETKEIYDKFVRNKSVSLVNTNVNLAEETSHSINPV